MEFNTQRGRLIEELSKFGTVELLSIKTHLALFITSNDTTGNNLDSLKTVSLIMDILTSNKLSKEYTLVQSMKNENNFFLITMNKELK